MAIGVIVCRIKLIFLWNKHATVIEEFNLTVLYANLFQFRQFIYLLLIPAALLGVPPK
jgi:hypothetical protein